MEKTKFEIDLEAYFPDIYKLHCLGKVDGKLWTSIYNIIKLIESREYGEVKITFQEGRINHTTTSITK
jgi:hypothetical protein